MQNNAVLDRCGRGRSEQCEQRGAFSMLSGRVARPTAELSLEVESASGSRSHDAREQTNVNGRRGLVMTRSTARVHFFFAARVLPSESYTRRPCKPQFGQWFGEEDVSLTVISFLGKSDASSTSFCLLQVLSTRRKRKTCTRTSFRLILGILAHPNRNEHAEGLTSALAMPH